MKKVIIHNKKRVFDSFFKIDEAEISFERFNRKMTPRLMRLCFERGDSVAAIIYNKDTKRVILVNQFKYPTFEKGPGWIVETVAGMFNEKESPEEALKREVLEETGYCINFEAIDSIADFYVSPGGSSERIFLYYVEVENEDKTESGGGVEQEGEDIEIVDYSIDALSKMLQSGEIKDAKTIIGIQWLMQRHSEI